MSQAACGDCGESHTMSHNVTLFVLLEGREELGTQLVWSPATYAGESLDESPRSLQEAGSSRLVGGEA